MANIHDHSEQDAATALVVMKTTELMRSLGSDVVKFSSGPYNGVHRVYARNENDRVYEMLVSDTHNGTHLFKFQSYSLDADGLASDDHRQWHAASKEEFIARMDDEILDATEEPSVASHGM